jgi:eukaryotic-like serine/threonine-protein kinase
VLPSFGNCRVLAELGSGSLSTVYHAVQEPLGREVAIKALKSSISTSSSFAVELEREARVLGDLCHPNIGALHELVKTDDQLYLILEYIGGPSLLELITRTTKLPAEVTAIIGAELARALEHAHERGVVHRDVKPGNVLLSQRGEVKLVDFGIARRRESPDMADPSDEASLAFGTPAYMSPEQILGEIVDSRSDLFSLGVVLYQMIAGVRPFEGDDAKDRRASTQRIRRAPAVPLRTRAPDVPRPLERIVMRLLEKLPADRYRSAGAVATELEEFFLPRVRGSPRGVVVRSLKEAGLSKAAAPAGEVTLAVEPRLRPIYLGFAAILALELASGAAIQWADRGAREASRAGDAPLELVPKGNASLRVLATPWANVSVDGQRVETTPFARPIPLTAGTHFVTLSHPDAPLEQRTIKLGKGESMLLDVTMNVPGLAPASASPPPAGSADSSLVSSADAGTPGGS